MSDRSTRPSTARRPLVFAGPLGLAAVLVLAGCSSIKPETLAATDDGSGVELASPDTTVAEPTPAVVLPAQLERADVVDAMRRAALEPNGNEYTILTSPGEGYENTEVITFGADGERVHVLVDHTDSSRMIEEQLAEAARIEAESDAEETFLPAYGAVAAGSSVPVEYVIERNTADGDMAWFRFADLVAYENAQLEMTLRLYEGYNDGEGGDATDLGLPEPKAVSAELEQSWFVQPYNADARSPFPPGLGPETVAFLDELASEVAGNDRYEFNEIGRTTDTIEVEFLEAGEPFPFITVELAPGPDGELNVVSATSQLGFELRIVHGHDSTSPSVIDGARVVTEEEWLIWQGIDPECVISGGGPTDDVTFLEADCDSGASPQDGAFPQDGAAPADDGAVQFDKVEAAQN